MSDILPFSIPKDSPWFGTIEYHMCVRAYAVARERMEGEAK